MLKRTCSSEKQSKSHAVKPNQKLAEALKSLKRLQDKHRGVIDSGDLKDALESTSVEGDIKPLARFLVEEMQEPEGAAFG
jgi:hypothetical protein